MRRCDCSKGEFTKQNQLHRCQESAQFLLMSNSINSCCKCAGFKFKFQVAYQSNFYLLGGLSSIIGPYARHTIPNELHEQIHLHVKLT
jgi:hypothetical protein